MNLLQALHSGERMKTIILDTDTNLSKVITTHAEMLESNPYCYFELAYTRYTEWMVFICSNQCEQDPNRKVLLHGQGFTPEEACADALSRFYQELTHD